MEMSITIGRVRLHINPIHAYPLLIYYKSNICLTFCTLITDQERPILVIPPAETVHKNG